MARIAKVCEGQINAALARFEMQPSVRRMQALGNVGVTPRDVAGVRFYT